MIRLLGLVLSIGFADSMNPSTLGPALYLASGRSPRRAVLEFTAGTFGVFLLGGLILTLGPGRAILALVPRPDATARYILETLAGSAMLVACAYLWVRRCRLGSRPGERPRERRTRSPLLMGATIALVELPTAFPYFAAIAAIVAADLDVARTFFLLLVFNLFFIAPLLGILAVLTFAGPSSQRLLTAGRERLEAHWPTIIAVLSLIAGLIVTFLGVTGLAYRHHNDFGTLSRRLRRLLHLRS